MRHRLFRRVMRILRWWIGEQEWKLLMEEMDRGHVALDRGDGRPDWAGVRRAWSRVQMRMQERAS